MPKWCPKISLTAKENPKSFLSILEASGYARKEWEPPRGQMNYLCVEPRMWEWERYVKDSEHKEGYVDWLGHAGINKVEVLDTLDHKDGYIPKVG